MSNRSAFLSTVNTPSLEVRLRPISELRPHPRCPRSHPARQIKKLADNIQAWGFLVPVLVDGGSQILAGHARVLAARKLGMADVPTISFDHLSEAQAQAFMIADNRLNELSSWDDRKLGELLFDLSLENIDFSLELTGFDMGEIDLRIEGLAEEGAAPDKADAVPEPNSGPSVTQPGDVWVLGRHRLLCASALQAESYMRLMEGEKAVMVFTDPPYNVRIRGHVSGLGQIKHDEFVMGSGEMTSETFTGFLHDALLLCAKNSIDGALHYVCMDWAHLRELLAAAGDVYTEQKNLCVWAKDNGGMGSLYRSQHELVAVFKAGRGPHRNNIELGKHGRNRTNVWRYPGVNSFRRTSEEGNLLALHPTVKPVQLVADAILDCSARGELVLDAFLGSGTTLIAAERVGRRCFGLELDPRYCDVVIRRWQAWSGSSATHADTGSTFDAHAAGAARSQDATLASGTGSEDVR